MNVTLEIHICDQRRSYHATFATEDQALTFVQSRFSNHTISELTDPGAAIPDTWTRLLDELYPTCEHGMSARSCYGPDHFMSAAQEQAMDWQYADAPAGF